MTSYLLDVNVLIPLLWPRHTQHGMVRTWFRAVGASSFATCSFTQAGFLRIISSPDRLREKFPLAAAKELLHALTQEAGHQFWPTTIDVFEATSRFESRMQGPKQITDAYLIALAIQHKGKLATMDRPILHLAGAEFRDYVELIA